MNEKKIKMTIALVLLLICGLVTPLFAFTRPDKPTRIKVGYTQHEVYHITPDGEIHGYLFSYLNKLKNYGNFDYQFIEVERDNELSLLADKKIDLLFFVNTEDAKNYDIDLSMLPVTNAMGLFYTKIDSNLYSEDYKNFNQLKVGYIRGSKRISSFIEYEKSRNFTTDLVPYDSYEEMNAALNKNLIQACIASSVPLLDQYKLIGEFDCPIDYLASYHNSSILKKVNTAMRYLNFFEPETQIDLYENFYGRQKNISFTRNEKNLVEEKEPLTVAIREGKKPLTYSENGEARGMLPLMVKQLAQDSGLNFQFKLFGDEVSEAEIKADPTVDFLILNTLLMSPFEQSICTHSIYNDSFVSVIKQNTIVNRDKIVKVGLLEYPKPHSEEFQNLWANHDYFYYPDLNSVLKAVQNGSIDAGILTQIRGKYLLKSPLYDDLVLTDVTQRVGGFALVPTSEKASQYISIINKSIAHVDDANGQKIMLANLEAEPYDLSFTEFMYKYSVIIILVCCVIVLLLIFFVLSQLNNKKLAEANMKATAATVAKSSFLANMSHELRTPLNAVIVLSSLLKDSLDERETTEDYVNKISESSQLLLSIINDILDMSAIENGKLKLAYEEFSIKKSIYSITTIYYQQCLLKGIHYEFNTNNIDYEFLIGDGFRIRQVLLNLLSNAVKFTPKNGHITVSLTEELIRDDDIMIHIAVQDTGCGISDDLKARLFSKFEQEDATTVRENGGSGLGLSIAKNLVDLMHGKIEVHSIEGEGTTFTVHIPLKIGKTKPENNILDFSIFRALIVDDNEETCKYISAITEKWHIKTQYCLDPLEALELVKKRLGTEDEFNLYIVDLKLPHMNGIDLTQSIQKLTHKKAVFMMISGYDFYEYKNKAQEKGVEYFLRKPIFPSELFNVLMNNFNKNNLLTEIDNKSASLALQDMLILLVEDNEINQFVATRLLEKDGAVVTIAKNGAEAVKEIKQGTPHYDVVLMDIQMPVMDGYEAVHQIRALPTEYAQHLPIFAMTASSFKSDIDKAYTSGMNGHISKPINPQILIDTILESKKKK